MDSVLYYDFGFGFWISNFSGLSKSERYEIKTHIKNTIFEFEPLIFMRQYLFSLLLKSASLLIKARCIRKVKDMITRFYSIAQYPSLPVFGKLLISNIKYFFNKSCF